VRELPSRIVGRATLRGLATPRADVRRRRSACTQRRARPLPASSRSSAATQPRRRNAFPGRGTGSSWARRPLIGLESSPGLQRRARHSHCSPTTSGLSARRGLHAPPRGRAAPRTVTPGGG
jgi:hypothetical protein